MTRQEETESLVEEINVYADNERLGLDALVALLEHADRERQNEALENIAEMLHHIAGQPT